MKKLTLIIALCMACQASKAQLKINELMQSNIDCIMDDLNDFPDSWVELYNDSQTGIDLRDYKLGLTDNAAEAWPLPIQRVDGKQYVLIYCDKVGDGLHTDFRLDSGKGSSVYLFQGDKVIDKVKDLKKQPSPNIAYGRKTDGADEWGYQIEPTPKAANCGEITDKILGDPVFSELGKVTRNNEAFSLTISLPEGTPEGTEIRMTTDGSEPIATSTLYTEPLSIKSTTVIRARLFCNGYLSPRSVAQSYIFFPRRMTLPVVSITTNKKYLKDPTIGIYVDGNYMSGKKNYEFNWRRPINIEIFDKEDNKSVINQLCETRIAGGATRSSARKSVAVYANKRFGTKHFEYEFFPDQKPGIKAQKSFMLRNAGNDFDYLYMRDAIIQRSMAQHVDLDWQAWQPAIIYINGDYQGMLNIRERSNEDNIWANYQKLEDIDMIEISQDNSRMVEELKAGSWDNYNAFKDFYREQGHTLKEYEEWMDCDEYINLMVMNLYFNNQDFPGNNVVLWRPTAEGGRWRWIAKDTDFGLGLYSSSADYKTIEWLYDPNYDKDRKWANTSAATRLFRNMMEDEDIKRLFIDRAAIYMGDFLNEKGVRNIWDAMYNKISYEYPNHRKLINEWWPNYNEELNTARRWLSKRTNIFYKQLADFFQLGTPIPISINRYLKSTPTIYFNDVELSEGKFDGKFFANRKVTLKAKAPEGKVITGWEVQAIETTGDISKTQVEGDAYSFTIPECTSMDISVILGDASAIKSLSENDWTWKKEGSYLYLSHVSEGTKVQLFDLRGMLLQTIVSDGTEISLPIVNHQLYVLKVGTKAIKL
jgi:hypothetical protein